MPGAFHQRILGLLVLRAYNLGYRPVMLDGRITGAPWENNLPLPGPIGRHRPDAICQDAHGRYAVCEAKTWDDLQSSRTLEQLEDFLAPWHDGEYARVVFGFPQSADLLAMRQIEMAGGLGCEHLILVSVPDEVLRES